MPLRTLSSLVPKIRMFTGLMAAVMGLTVANPAMGLFFESEGTVGLLGVSHYDPHSGATEGPLQGVEQLFHLGLEIKPGDLTSLYLDVGFWPIGERYYWGGDYERTADLSESNTYEAFTPRVSQLYLESATRYCLVSLGRRAKHIGLGIFLDDGTDPWDTHQSLFEGISCTVGPGLWRTLKVEVGADKLREGFILEKGDDTKQFHALIAYDDRHVRSSSDLKKQVSLYFAFRDSSSPHLLGESSDKYLDLFGGLYWKNLTFEAEGLIRMGKGSGRSWEDLGARPERLNSVDALAVHAQASFTYPDPNQSASRSRQKEYWQPQLAEPSAQGTKEPSAQNMEESSAEEEEPSSTAESSDDTDSEESSNAETGEIAEEENTEEDSYDDEDSYDEDDAEAHEVAEGDADSSQEKTDHGDAGGTAEDSSSEPPKSSQPSGDAQTVVASEGSSSSADVFEESGDHNPGHSSWSGQYYHRVTTSYTFAPGDSQGYYKGDDEYLGDARRSDKVTALALNPNFKPAMILFNMRTRDLDIDGVYSGIQVVNAHVFTLGYSFLHSQYGNGHFKVIGANMDRTIPLTVENYFKRSGGEYYLEGYYDFALYQYYPVGYLVII